VTDQAPSTPPFDPLSILSNLTGEQIQALAEVLVAEDPLYTIAEAADYLGVSSRDFYGWRVCGTAPAECKLPSRLNHDPSEMQINKSRKSLYRRSVLNAFALTRQIPRHKAADMTLSDAHVVLYAMGLTANRSPGMDRNGGATIGQAAEHLGISVSTLRKWDAAGRLQPDRNAHGDRVYDLRKLDRGEVERIVASCKRGALAKRLPGISTADAAAALGVSSGTVARLCRAGRMACHMEWPPGRPSCAVRRFDEAEIARVRPLVPDLMKGLSRAAGEAPSSHAARSGPRDRR